ncbi:hypothetical protein WH47_03987 [Habropoda laboriosa]|uniref:Uncharacterized protein n=1 Tax=Habropoda laboriosa TaxID=597456 RepID=A0A0L7QUJ0_9HYME|nr:hypothetical protein WH47_03987 [Habropoda laboriosa]
MEDEISCDDPQFMSMLETCLRVEIETVKGTASGLKMELGELKNKMQTGLQTRRELKENTTNIQENISILNSTLNKQSKYMNEISHKIELMKLNLDNDYKVMKLECEQYEDIYKEYENTWEIYHAKYEEFPLAKERMEAKIKLKKIQVEKMAVEFKINEFKKIKKQQDQITWFKMRAQIVEFARAYSNSSKLDQQLNDLKEDVQNSQEELNRVKSQVFLKLLDFLRERQEEEKKDRALRLLEMPPPRINFSHMRRIYGPRTGFLDGWKRNDENSIDTLSVDTLLLEEMCQEKESSVHSPCTVETQEEEGKVCNSQPIDARSRSLDQQEQPEVEHEDAASEVDENAGPDAIDAHIEEMEHRVDRELEHFEQPPDLSEDKQTEQRSEDYTEQLDDPVAKKIRLISVEEKPTASPIRNVQLKRKRSLLTDQSAGPRITKVEAVNYDLSSAKNNRAIGLRGSQLAEESPSSRIDKIDTVRYNMSSVKRMEKNGSRGSQLVDQSPGSNLMKMSPMKKLEQDNPNPSSMFTPRHYDYSDNSNISFCIEKNMSALKDDQISLYGGSVRDFCECINISSSDEQAREIPVAECNANVPSTSKNHDFPRFDFSNIIKKSSSRNNLF